MTKNRKKKKYKVYVADNILKVNDVGNKENGDRSKILYKSTFFSLKKWMITKLHIKEHFFIYRIRHHITLHTIKINKLTKNIKKTLRSFYTEEEKKHNRMIKRN